jgi:mitosis inhibitor protein kinase SWE1
MPEKPAGDGDLCMSGLVESNLVPKPSLGRVEKRRSGNFSFVPSVSPLKRSDGISSLDQAGIESPLAKRRSLHGTTFGSDFSIFDSHESDRADEDVQSAQSSPTGPFATIPRRTSSLRKSTLQQRQNERSIFSRPRLSRDHFDSPSTNPATITRHRLSLGNDVSHSSGLGSLFPAPLALPSNHPIFSSSQPSTTQTPHAAHPLSRTITQSSSSSSLVDDSPTHEPIHKGERPRQVYNFSKSLPPGATRPAFGRQLTREDSTSSSDSLATPENYKLVKPLPAAFMSTGLISKKNRNAEDPRNSFGLSKNMPDTPCKRSTNLLPTGQKPLPARPIQKPKLVRQSVATPSTPFSSQFTHPIPGPFTRGPGLFGNVFNKPEISRRGSFVSVDGDDQSLSLSPSTNHDTQSTAESDLPPTPTRQPLTSLSDRFSFGSQTLVKGSSRKPFILTPHHQSYASIPLLLYSPAAPHSYSPSSRN